MEKKLNLTDATIQIRIMRALEDIKPFGMFKHFYMIKALRNLKQPNVITSLHMWEFLKVAFEVEKYNQKADSSIAEETVPFDEIFTE